MNIKKTKIVTTEKVHNFNTYNEDIEIVENSVYLVSLINSNGDCGQEIKREICLTVGRAATKVLGKISKSENVLLKKKAKIIHTLMIVPVVMYRSKS